MYQREALWIRFEHRYWKPNAVKIAVGKVNAVSGKPWEETLRTDENDYLVCPPQLWLDGINAGVGYIRQFIAMPLGLGYTVESQVTGDEKYGGIQIIVYEPKPGKFPDQPPPRAEFGPARFPTVGADMGLAAGGKMKQKIYPDPHGIDTWDQENYGYIFVHIVNSIIYREITGKEPPASPVTAETYTRHGLPWFDLHDETLGDVSTPEVLTKVKTVNEIDEEKGITAQQDDSTLEIPDDQLIIYKLDPLKGAKGDNP
jgi:hypothetical protein